MKRIEIYILAIAMLSIGAAGGWFAGKSVIADKLVHDGVNLKVNTAMPPKPGVKAQ